MQDDEELFARFKEGIKAATSGSVMEGLRRIATFEELLVRFVGV